MPGLKAKLARAFLNFLDEHGDYRTTLEEAAARAAAAEANSLWAKDRRGRKKRRRRGRGLLGDDDENELLEGDEGYDDEEEESEGLLPPPSEPPKHPPLPEDPYEQIQFYFRTFTHRTKLQWEERLDRYRTLTKNWVHDELHHPARVPLLSGGMLAATVLLWAIKARRKKLSGIARIHGILGKKLTLGEYVHPNFFKGRMLLQFSGEGKERLAKMQEKANKAEEAALASMRPYQRTRYERFCKLERAGEWAATVCLALGVLASGVTLLLSLAALVRGEHLSAGLSTGEDGERLDGHIYSLDGPTDSDGYPIGMREAAEEKYAACLWEAEEQGIDDPTTVCNVESFFDEAAAGWNGASLEDGEAPTSPLRTRIHRILISHFRFPAALASYLTALRTQTIAYLSSLFTFLLFLTSHYVAHKIHLLTMAHDPMKHFVLAATDKSVKADGTVEAKRGETEAQRKRRERMLQNERLKAKMAQLAMEAKKRVEERRQRLEGEAAAERAKEEEQKKVAEEQEEIVKCHSRQFMMLKAGVPEGAILNSLLAEGIEGDEAKEIVEKLKDVKARRAAEAKKLEEAEARKAEEETKAEEEKERIAQERLKRMKGQRSKGSSVGGGGSIGSGSVGSSSIQSKSSVASGEAVGQSALKPAARRPTPKSIPYNPAPRPGSSTILSGNLPVGAKSDKRWDRETKAWVNAEVDPSVYGRPSAATTSPGDGGGVTSGVDPAVFGRPSAATTSPRRTSSASDLGGTPKKSNTTEASNGLRRSSTAGDDGARGSPVGGNAAFRRSNTTGDEAVKGESTAAREARETIVAAARLPPEMPLTAPADASAKETAMVSKQLSKPIGKEDAGNDSDDSSATPILVRVSMGSPDCDAMESPDIAPSADPVDPFQRPSARDIQAQITAVENEPEEEAHDVDLAPAWMHSPAFEAALRTSNASWDRRPTSRDITARIRAVEQYEQRAAKDREERQQRRSLMQDDSLGIIDEKRQRDGEINPASSFEMRRKPGKAGGEGENSDDEISELSEPTYVSKEDAFGGRTVPRALFVPQNDAAQLSPMVTGASALSPHEGRRNLAGPVTAMGARGALPAPPPLRDVDEKAPQDAAQSDERIEEDNDAAPTAPPKVETEEERKRRERAEARVKKIEAIAARRNAGEDADDDESAVSGISKRRSHLRRKKKKEAAALAAMEENSVKSDCKSDDKSGSTPAREETEEERKRRERASARAKKLEAMAARRNAGKAEDDDTAVTGISKRHRLRRKKSALAAISPEERERNEWKQGVYGSVLNAERKHWQTSVYAHVLNAEATRETNMEAARQLEEQNAAAQRRKEHQKRLDAKAKKFAARAERFHKIRREGGDEDDASVVSSASRMRRRRGRKSSGLSRSVAKVEEVVAEPVTVDDPKEKKERNEWCSLLYTTILCADECKWKRNVYGLVLTAEDSKAGRLELAADIEKRRAAFELKREKERKTEERARKVEAMKAARDGAATGEENVAPDGGQSAAPEAGSMSRLKKMRNRRKKAAKKKANS